MNGKHECDCGSTPRRIDDERLEAGSDPQHGRRVASDAGTARRDRGTLLGLAYAAFSAGWVHGSACPTLAAWRGDEATYKACFAAWIRERARERLGSGQTAYVAAPGDAEAAKALEAFDLWLLRALEAGGGQS